MSFDLSSMERGDLCRDRCMSLLLADPMQDTGAARPNAGGAMCKHWLKRLSHNSKSQQKEARTGRYIKKQASNFIKYPIIGQPLKSGV